MRTRLLILPLLLMLAPAGCDDELTAADCEALTTEDACEKKGCTFVEIHRSVPDGPGCVAIERRPGCILAGQSWNNAEGALCRDLPGGGFEFVLFGAGRPADGWESCGLDIEDRCDISIAACEGLTDRTACEAAYCYWAEPVRVGVIDDQGACTGWEPQTTGLCLTPEPYLTFFEGVSDFDRWADEERFFSVTPVEGPRRVYAFPVSPGATFTSGPPAVPDEWRTCDSATAAPCSCP